MVVSFKFKHNYYELDRVVLTKENMHFHDYEFLYS